MTKVIRRKDQITYVNRYDTTRTYLQLKAEKNSVIFFTESFCKENDTVFFTENTHDNVEIKVAHGWRLSYRKNQSLAEATIRKDYFNENNPIYRVPLKNKGGNWLTFYQSPAIQGIAWNKTYKYTPVCFHSRVWAFIHIQYGSGWSVGSYIAIPKKHLQRRLYRGLGLIPPHVQRLSTKDPIIEKLR